VNDAGHHARPSVLAEILRSTEAEVARRRGELPLAALAMPATPGGRLRDALAAPGMSVIAEFKRRSPSAGEIRVGARVPEVAAAYERGGAAAMSVLTEGPHFGGSLSDLPAARKGCVLPLLRKDFIVDRYQLHEARAAGADAILLIVAALDPAALRDLHAEALALGLDVLVEVHDRDEVGRALAVEPQLVGINNRDLRDFSVDVSRTYELLTDLPPGLVVVAESGIKAASQLRELADAGVSAVLVGESLMRADDPAQALLTLRGVDDSSTL